MIVIRLRSTSGDYLDQVPLALEAVPAQCWVRLTIPHGCRGVSHALLTAIAELGTTAAGIQLDTSDPESPAALAIMAVLAGCEPLTAAGVR